MRHGLRPTSLAIGALALGLLALPGAARAMPAPALADTGPGIARASAERAIFAGEGVLAPETVTYYYQRRNYNWNPYCFYRYRPQPRYYNYYRGPRQQFYNYRQDNRYYNYRQGNRYNRWRYRY